MAQNDLFTTDIPTPSNPARRMVESTRMSLAPVPSPAAAPGAVPPQNLEAEESVLGAMMIAPGAIAAVSEILDAGDFYRESHGKIYRAALQLYGKNEPVDAITLTSELEQRGELEAIGGRVRLHELARLVPATANARHYAEIVRENATLRGLIGAGGEIARLGWEREGEPAELVARAEQLVYDLGERRAQGELVLFKDTLVETFQRLSLLELRARAQTLKRREPNLALVVVDYLQLMTTGRSEESRLQEVSAISRGLKEIAKDLDLPVVALSQLNRSPEQRHDKRPMLSDLRESGSIEQDADLVMFLYREEYYERDETDDSNKGIAEVIVAKHRNGPTGDFKVAFISKYAKFASLAH